MPEDIAALEAQRDAAAQKVTGLEMQVADLTVKVNDITKALEAVTGTEKVLRVAVVTELDRLAPLVKREAELAAFRTAFGADLASMPADQALGLVAQWTKLFDEAHPVSGRQSESTALSDQGNTETNTIQVGALVAL